MMSKLKSLLLFCCFGLFGLSFVNAENGYFGNIGDLFTTSNYNSNYSITMDQYGNFSSQYLGNTKQLFMPGKGNFIYWSSDGVPYIYYSSYINEYAGNNFVTYQGSATKYFVCDTSDLLNFQSSNASSLYSLSCSSNNVSSESVSYFSNFLGTLKSTDTYYYYRRQTGCNSNSMWEFFVCLNSSELGQSLCFGDVSRDCAWWLGGDTNYYGGISNTGNVFDSNRNNVSFDSIDSSLLKSSPYNGSSFPIESDSDVIYYSDNNKIYYDVFHALGFYDGLCYSNFSLSDHFDIHTTYNDLFPIPSAGSGASVFDLYNSRSYSSFNPFRAWFSLYNSKYNKLDSSSDKGTNYILSLYSGGDSFGDFYIFEKLNNNSYIDSYDFSVVDYESFCSLVVNGYDPDGMFTGKTSISFDNIMTSSPCIRNGTCIGNVNGSTQFILSGSDSYGYFSGSSSIFNIFNSLYSNLRNAFHVDGSLSGSSGLLPAYIILGFFLFVLLYIFKR